MQLISFILQGHLVHQPILTLLTLYPGGPLYCHFVLRLPHERRQGEDRLQEDLRLHGCGFGARNLSYLYSTVAPTKFASLARRMRRTKSG